MIRAFAEPSGIASMVVVQIGDYPMKLNRVLLAALSGNANSGNIGAGFASGNSSVITWPRLKVEEAKGAITRARSLGRLMHRAECPWNRLGAGAEN